MSGDQPLQVQELQHEQLKEYWRYLFARYAADCRTGLDVGCGSGLWIDYISDSIEMKGIDIHPDQVKKARSSGIDVVTGDGNMLPFKDNSFDLVTCSFYLMWVKDVKRAMKEMMRVARKKVLILAEPIWSRTLVEPPELKGVLDASILDIQKRGGDPDGGSMMLNTMTQLGLEFRYGTIPLDTTIDDVRRYVDNEIMIHGEGQSVPEPILFNVPFIWALVNLS